MALRLPVFAAASISVSGRRGCAVILPATWPDAFAGLRSVRAERAREEFGDGAHFDRTLIVVLFGERPEPAARFVEFAQQDSRSRRFVIVLSRRDGAARRCRPG